MSFLKNVLDKVHPAVGQDDVLFFGGGVVKEAKSLLLDGVPCGYDAVTDDVVNLLVNLCLLFLCWLLCVQRCDRELLRILMIHCKILTLMNFMANSTPALKGRHSSQNWMTLASSPSSSRFKDLLGAT